MKDEKLKTAQDMGKGHPTNKRLDLYFTVVFGFFFPVPFEVKLCCILNSVGGLISTRYYMKCSAKRKKKKEILYEPGTSCGCVFIVIPYQILPHSAPARVNSIHT